MFTLLYKLYSRPPPTPKKTSFALRASGEAWKQQKPHLQFPGPSEGVEFISVIFLYGDVWFGVPDCVSRRA